MGLWLLIFAALLNSGCGEKADQSSSTARPSADSSSTPRQWFTEITDQAGLDFVHDSGATGGLFLPEIMLSGAALFDFDNDGDLDIYLTNGNHELPETTVASNAPNRMYRQETNGRFVDVTEHSGLGSGAYGMGVAIGDIDNDGDLDLYATNFGPDVLYRNGGDGIFSDVTADAGVDVDGWSSSAAFFDYDRDGFLDLYVARYVVLSRLEPCYDRAGRPTYCGPKSFPPVTDVLLHNNGDGTFTDVSEQAGLTLVLAAGLGVVCDDFNDDGWQDIYVANDGYANQLWLNNGDGTFTDAALVMGAALSVDGQAEAGMGVVAADFDNDSLIDLFMTHLAGETNTLYRNRGGAGGFEETTALHGLASSSLSFTGFGTVAFDAELDGDLDLLVVNGRVKRAKPLAGAAVNPPWDRYAEPNLFYINDGYGSFELRQEVAVEICLPIEVSRGLAAGDIDGDGDIDLLVTNIHGPARLYRNDAPRDGHWLIVRAIDDRLKRDAIGARITVSAGGKSFVRTISGGFSYLSSSELRAHFGVGAIDQIEKIEVRWPDGLREQFGAMPADQSITLHRGEGERIQ